MYQKLFKYFIALLLCLGLAVSANAASKMYWATGLTGGGDALDGIDGAGLAAGDGAIVILDSGTNAPVFYVYRLQASSASESSPNVIVPNSNAGTSAWHLSGVIANGGLAGSRIVASGSVTQDNGSIASGACSNAIDGGTATGVATTDRIVWNFNGDPTGVTGFAPLAAGGLYVIAYPTSDHVNFKFCNNTAGAIDPGSVVLNWMVLR
jgi:hypothetical protein